MEVVSPYKDAIDMLLEEGGGPFLECYQCGLCTGTCPWNRVKGFSVRRLIHESQLGLVDYESEDVWMCVGCNHCVERCPKGVNVPEIMRAIRRAIVGLGLGPVTDSLRITMKNISAMGNPLGEDRENRTDWAKGLDVKTHTPGTEVLYFPCCYQAYDPSLRRVALATVDILKKADVDFGILDSRAVCCGESIRKAGAESVFQNLVQENIQTFKEIGVKKILVTSPHCYHTFKDEYPAFGGDFEVIHLSQYLVQLIDEGRLKLSKEVNQKVTYHDSCCLGRYAGIYDEPRHILEGIPGLELAEMRETREDALCCGGCAGRLWMETKKGERFSDLRIDQALDTGAQVLAIHCPYCMLNFEDSLLGTEKSESIEVRDIAELVQQAI